MNREILENNGVDITAALALLGDMDMYNETLAEFLEESKTRLPNIINYYNAQDMANYSILVHAMKSDSKYLGFSRLAELSYNHEMASKEGNVDYVSMHINELIEEANRIIGIATKYLEG